MASKKQLQLKIAHLQMQLTEARVPPLPTVRNLTVCFPEKTVNIDGRTIHVETDCLVMPILSGEWVPR